MEQQENQPNYNKATFLLSAADVDQLPPDEGVEVAFIGCSNAGKSSALNTITGIKGLARISKTPGRTQMINFFGLDDRRRMVDLPGYGYAKVPLPVKQRWQQVVNQYLQKRRILRGLVIVMDIRHPLKALDEQLIEWATFYQLPVHILLTKADKIKKGAAKNTLLKVREALKEYGELLSVQLFSSQDKTGLDEAKTLLDTWFAKQK